MSTVNRKQHIAQVALQLFGEKGFENASTQQIAKAAGVSEALIFKHFGSKDQLLDFVIRSGYKRIIEENRGWLSEQDPLTFIHAVIDLPVKLVQTEPHFWKLQYRLANVESARQQHERFMQPVPALLEKAFKALGYEEPEKEASLLLLLVEALWKIEANKTDEHVRDMLDFIKRKYQPQ
ncbi:TetR/AcrR family transcriptional regulator [Hymenobacter sp. 15J16-1T3B]|uniref:TetR/AcrR family transcriptional regulator n=1 Tax=Hymenobacter sp. 15J16-1T3B TaxID=2886941 RepID=UPI001D126F9B|nr:TetR/AcrR family transcriptional regulator [Hymenobacter sp. 15J16-1T3B]MCC3160032.1 TetR/AcrR family transcriptional regulator [Hymenobacter sp. 15J16-1T3B]